jgi:hypothetical protein
MGWFTKIGREPRQGVILRMHDGDLLLASLISLASEALSVYA